MDKDNTSSSSPSSQPQNQIEEETTTFYRSKNKSFNSVGIPLRSSDRSAAIQKHREYEKRELSHLNDRFASYIERVRFLEAHNKKLQLEIDDLRGKWGLQTNKLKEKYNVEIHQARVIIDDTAKDRAIIDLRVKRAEDEKLKLQNKYELLLAGRDSDRQKIELLEKQLLDNEADLSLFHRRLIDLEDEKKRHSIKSEKLNLDIEHIKKDLDHEIITRIQLENQKQTLEEEINFLKEIHSQEIEELKQINLIDTTLDSVNFFKHELANAIQNIRQEYEQLNYQQRNETQSWYQLKVSQAIQEIQSHQAIKKSENIREQEEIKKLRTLVSDSQQDITAMRRRNGELENRIQELEKLIKIERNNNIQASDERDRKIKDLRIHLEDLGRNYDELISTKSTLDSEIAIYRKLLEGEEHRKGLKQIAEDVEKQARANSVIVDRSITYSPSYQRTDESQESEIRSSTNQALNSLSDDNLRNNNERIPSIIHEQPVRLQHESESSDAGTDYDSSIEDPNERFDNKNLMLTTYVPYQSSSLTQTESTIFEQVYGVRRRRPTSINLCVQWVPVVDHSSINRWSTSDINNRKFKTETFFETGAIRAQQQSKAVTPPSSDYTDAYLNAFAPKTVSTRRIYRINAPVFANVAPLRTNLSTNSSIRTSQTRFNNINSNQTSPFPTSSSTYSSSFIPDTYPKYEPLSNTQSSVSETQTYNSNDSIPLRNRQSSETTIHTSPQPSSSTISSTYSSKSPPKNVDKPMPSDSLKSYSPSPSTSLSSSAIISTYKPSVSFQSAPLSFSNNIRQSSTNGQTVLPSLKTEKQIERPEILLFQHDEDIRSSCIEKPSPIITPLLESPITRIESKTEPERTSSEDLEIASSKPIEILEKTISKYDSIIDQISEVLASVSPLSSTVSSMSPGKSVLDYEFTSDGSPILQRKQIEPQPSQEATTPIKNMNIQRIKGKHLIRDDSYDKIMTAIEDLDNELTPPPEIEKLTTTVIEEEKEEPVTPSLEDHQIPSSSSEQLKGEVKNLSLDKQTPSSIIEKKEEEKVLQQLLSVTKSEVNESLTSASNTLTCELHPLNETELDEEKFVEVQPKTETPLDNVEFVQQQADLLSNVPIVETTENKMERPNDELRSNKNNGKRVTWSETVVVNNDDESSLSQSLTEESSISEAPIEKERLTLDESTTIVEQQINSFIPTEKVAVDDQVNPLIPIESSTNVIERQIESPSSPSTSSSLSDSVDRETTSSDINQSQSSHDEQIPSSRSSGDTHFVFTTDFSNKNTSTVSEQSSTILDVVSKDSTDLQIEEIESNQTEAPIQLDDVTASETRTSTIENTPLLSLPTIESPINTLTDLISTRFISNDVYHGYLGDHTQFIENPSDIDTENMKISLLASLRQTIATPATPLIETIQSVVSSRRTLTASQPLKNENEVIDHHQNDERLATTMIVDSNEENDEHGTHIDESERTVNAFEEPKTMFESLRDTITEPMPTIGSNLQEDKQTVLSTSSAEPVSEVLTLTEDVKDLKTLQPTPSHDNIGSFVENLGDHSINEIELVPSSLFDSIQEKVSDAITTLAETIQNVEPTDVPSIQTQIAEQQILASLPLDTFREQSIDNPMNASVVLTSPIDIAPSINATSSEMPTLSSVEAQTVESIAPTSIVHDNEQVLTTNAVLSEPIDTGDTEEVTHFNGTPEASDVTISEQKILDETIHLLTSITEKIDENLSLVEQNVTSTNDHPNIEQIISIETIRDQPSDAILLKDEITTTDQTNIQIVPTSSITTEVTSTFETNELASDSNKENEPTFQIIHELINDITQTVLSQLQQHSMETEQEIVIMPDTISFKTEIENASSKDFRESSPTNTELDSLELIDALRGHSIIRPNSSEQIYYPPSRSPSTTTSSQITSSDRYVSYAIHKMGDSSQERLPSFPITADIPIYKTIEDNILPKPNIINNQSILKEDDSTEFDATENLTYSDEILLQKLQTSATNRQKNFDTSSTDDDVDEEIEQHDLTDLERLLDKLTVKNTSSNAHEESYQRYDLATTSSSNDSSSSSKQQPDDIYFIPGYSGLWRPSSNNDNTDLPIDYDADDERKSSTKTRTIVRTLNSSKRPLIFQHPQNQSENLTSGIPLRPDSIDISNRPINEFTFDISESDSYQTCPSSESKQEKEISEQQKISSEESIFLIHEHERGVSLPITMKIDCDDITFRLSTSSPIDTHLYSRIQPDLSSPSTHSEPPLPVNTDTNSQASSPSSNDQQKLPSWLNTINTVTTTTEEGDGPIASRITLLKSAKGPISISECHPQGNYIIIENTSRSKNIDLKNWKIQQENDNGDILIFTFPDHCLLRPNHSLKILTTTNQSEQKPDDLVASSLSSWHTGPNILTLLINPEGKECSTLTKKTIFS